MKIEMVAGGDSGSWFQVINNHLLLLLPLHLLLQMMMLWLLLMLLLLQRWCCGLLHIAPALCRYFSWYFLGSLLTEG